MKEHLIEGTTLPDAYHKALTTLEHEGELLSCSQWNQTQKECAMTVHIASPLQEPRISRLTIMSPYSLQQYMMEMLDGVLNGRIGHGWDYTYESRYAPYLPWCVEELRAHPDSRRAVISIRDNDADTKPGADAACLQSMQFLIRNNALCMHVLFRSNDLPEAFFPNAFALIALQERVAAQLGVPVGTYTHRSNSMHCYSKDFELLKGYVDRIERDGDTTWSYEDDWREQMAEEIPSINDSIRRILKTS
jgi:thymidylate synthase